LLEPRTKARFTGTDTVIKIEGDYDEVELASMWLTESEKEKALQETFQEIQHAGGMNEWKSLKWIQ